MVNTVNFQNVILQPLSLTAILQLQTRNYRDQKIPTAWGSAEQYAV